LKIKGQRIIKMILILMEILDLTDDLRKWLEAIYPTFPILLWPQELPRTKLTLIFPKALLQ
jgi:hypothetical protein